MSNHKKNINRQNSSSSSSSSSNSSSNSGSDSDSDSSSSSGVYPPDFFTIDESTYIEKIEKDICIKSGKLAIGEYKFYGEKINPGYYTLFRMDCGSLIVVPKGTTEDELLTIGWNICDYCVNVEGGTFGFCDAKFIEIENECDLNPEECVEIGFGYANMCISQYTNEHYWMEIDGKILRESSDNKKLTKWIDKNKLEDEMLGFFCSNGFGDGEFNVYKGDKENTFLILSYNYYS
jgi:hypothetical protein